MLAAATLVLNLLATYSARPERWDKIVRWAFLAALGAQALALVLLLVKVNGGPHYFAEYTQGFEVRLVDSPFLLAGVATALFASIAWIVLDWKYDSIVGYLPSRDSLDSLIYKTVAISFPLLTFMIIAGAYWANRTWGAYWSWDPKEDWALITWLTYAGYLHMRLTRGWRERRSAYFAIIGFGDRDVYLLRGHLLAARTACLRVSGRAGGGQQELEARSEELGDSAAYGVGFSRLLDWLCPVSRKVGTWLRIISTCNDARWLSLRAKPQAAASVNSTFPSSFSCGHRDI